MIFLSLFCCFASLYCTEQVEDKIYLTNEQVSIQDQQLFVFVENQWRPTNALFSDGNGVYILARSWYEPWECSFCGAVNPPHRFVCWNCGR